MRKLLVLVPAIAVCLLLSSCEVKSDHPLSSPKSAQVDSRLLGDWCDPHDPDKPTFRFTAIDAHWMHLEIIHGKPGEKNESYDLFTTVIGPETYLNTRMIDKNSDGTFSKYYEFTHYIISDNGTLKMWPMSDETVAAAIRAGKLSGNVDEIYDTAQPKPLHPNVNVTLTSSSEDMTNYIRNSNVYRVFKERMNPLHRVATPAK